MKKIRIAQIGTSQYSHGNSIWNSFLKQSDLFEVVGYAEEKEEICEPETTAQTAEADDEEADEENAEIVDAFVADPIEDYEDVPKHIFDEPSYETEENEYPEAPAEREEAEEGEF